MTSAVLAATDARARTLLGAGALVGAGWYLAQEYLPGQLDVVVAFGVLGLVATWLARRAVLPAARWSRLHGAAAVALLVVPAWRDAEALAALNLFALAVLLAWAIPAGAAGSAGLVTLARRGLVLGLSAAVGPLVVLRGLEHARAGGGTGRVALRAVMGLAAVAPLLLLFGALLGEADPLFGRALEQVLSLRLVDVVGQRALQLFAWTWIATGLLWGWVLAASLPERDVEVLRGRFGGIEIGTALAALALLFALFLGFQARYLFGGAAYVAATAGVTVAEYARRGFFEVVAVVALMVPVLLLADWLLDRSQAVAVRVVRGLAALLLVLLGVMLVAALGRMRLYLDTFGPSTLRLYVAAFLVWLVTILGLFAATVLRDRRGQFLPGLVAAGILAVLTLDVLNPDAYVARQALARAARGGGLDVEYVSRLSADALPALAAGTPALEPALGCTLRDAVAARWARPVTHRTWTVARARHRDLATPCR